MRKLIGVIVVALFLAAPTMAITYVVDTTSLWPDGSSNSAWWLQQPPAGGIGSYVYASGQPILRPPKDAFLGYPGSSFDLRMDKTQDAVPTAMPGYTWETPYDPGTPFAISVDGFVVSDGSGVTSLMNYNNNDPTTGLPSEFLFVGEGSAQGLSYRFEAYWDASLDPAYPVMVDGEPAVIAALTRGTLEVVPEPLTMLGLTLGLGSVGAYMRKRRMA